MVGVKVVERLRICGHTVRHSEVNSQTQVNLTPSENILQESVSPVNAKLKEIKISSVFLQLKLGFVLFELG
jgi:hypothetical protein